MSRRTGTRSLLQKKGAKREETPTRELDIAAAKLTPDVHRRILSFLNTARRPQDLERLAQAEIREELWKRILELRNKLGAYGFADLKQLLEYKVLSEDLIRRLTILFGPRFYGDWAAPYETQLPDGTSVSVAHAALLHTGRVLFFQEASTPITFLWDPSDETTPKFEFPKTQPDEYLFCSGHSFLSDGKLLAAGGGGGGPSNVNRAWKFDPESTIWTKTTGDMTYARWYPTLVTLGDERRVMVVGGSPNVSKIELYDEYTDDFTPIAMPTERSFPQHYPGLHLLPGGEIFYSRTGFGGAGAGPGGGDPASGTPYFRFTGSASGEWVEIENSMEFSDRVRGMSVLLLDPCEPTVRVIVIGGSTTGSDTAEVANLSMLNPTWDEPTLIPGGVGRTNVNAVLLPDGTVFVCGGSASVDFPSALYRPTTNSWSEMTRLNYPKRYHSVALLLPSGKVMATGGANYGGGSKVIEIFSPPYLFRGVRPTITSAPALVHHADTFELETPQASQIESVVFARPMAVTHQTDTEQRVIQTKFTRDGNTLTITAPDHEHPHLAPRGYYMLFIIDSNGVPSEGKFIFLH